MPSDEVTQTTSSRMRTARAEVGDAQSGAAFQARSGGRVLGSRAWWDRRRREGGCCSHRTVPLMAHENRVREWGRRPWRMAIGSRRPASPAGEQRRRPLLALDSPRRSGLGRERQRAGGPSASMRASESSSSAGPSAMRGRSTPRDRSLPRSRARGSGRRGERAPVRPRGRPSRRAGMVWMSADAAGSIPDPPRLAERHAAYVAVPVEGHPGATGELAVVMEEDRSPAGPRAGTRRSGVRACNRGSSP